MVETTRRQLSGHAYEVTEFPARQGLRLQARLLRIVGPSIAALGAEALQGAQPSDVGSLLDVDISSEALTRAVGELVARLDEQRVERLILDLLGQTTRDGRPVGEETEFDAAYTGNYGELLRAIGLVLEVNFGSFFGARPTGGATAGPTPPNETGAYRES